MGTLCRWMCGCLLLWGASASSVAQDDRRDPLAPFQEETDTYLELWRKGEYQASKEFLEKAVRNSTDGVPMRWLYDRADLAFALGRVDEAISEIEWLHYRRPAPQSALQLALFQRERGLMDDYRRTLERAAERYARFVGEKDDTENTIAVIRMRELMGENPRALFQELARIQDDDLEDKVAIQLASGDLAFRKFDYQLAAEKYEAALKLDADNLDAMAGLAECYWKSGDERLEPMLDKVTAVNPRHPRALGVRAEMALDLGDTAAAMTHIEAFLAVNPVHAYFLGLKSAAQFLDNDLDAMRVTQQEALLFNSHNGTVYRVTGRIASRHYRFEEAAAFQRRALDIDPADTAARALYAFDLLRMGEDADGRRQLTRAFEEDRFNVQVYNMLELLDTLDGFQTVKAPPFLLKMPERERNVWGDEVTALLREAYTHFEKRYAVKLADPIHIQIFDNHDDFMVRSVGLPGSVGYLGICFGRLITMDTPSARTRGTLNWRATLWHEFVHVVTLQKTNNRMPRWLSEGISVYEETQRNPAWGQRPSLHYRDVVAEEEAPALRDLERYFTQPKSQFHVLYGYYLGGEFVRFYVDAYGHPALVEALALMGEGRHAVDALVAASGVTEARLDAAFATFVAKLTAPYKNVPDPKALRAAGFAVAPPFQSAMESAMEAMAEKRVDDAERWLVEAEAVFPGLIGPDSPRALLAELYRTAGRTDDYQRSLEQLFAADGTDWKTCHALAEIYRDASRWRDLEKVARRGLSIDPFDITMHRARLDALTGLDRVDDALAALNTLIDIDGENRLTYAMRRVDLYLGKNRHVEARREVLALLEEIPYAWEAQKRLLQVQGALEASP